jgi:hypothetical protein
VHPCLERCLPPMATRHDTRFHLEIAVANHDPLFDAVIRSAFSRWSAFLTQVTSLFRSGRLSHPAQHRTNPVENRKSDCTAFYEADKFNLTNRFVHVMFHKVAFPCGNPLCLSRSSLPRSARQKMSVPPLAHAKEISFLPKAHPFDFLEPEDVVPPWKHWSPILLRLRRSPCRGRQQIRQAQSYSREALRTCGNDRHPNRAETRV